MSEESEKQAAVKKKFEETCKEESQLFKKLKKHADIYKTTFKPVAIILIIFIAISKFYGRTDFIYSALLGACFSFITFRQLILAQAMILEKGKTSAVLFLYVLRLTTTALPIILSLMYKSTFQLWITLLFLFTFQATFVLVSVMRKYKTVKKVMDKWTK